MWRAAQCKRPSACWPPFRCTDTSKWNYRWLLKRFSIRGISRIRRSYAGLTIIWMHVWLRTFNRHRRYNTFLSAYPFVIPYSSEHFACWVDGCRSWTNFFSLLLCRWRHKILILFKLMLLQKRVVCFGSPVKPTCSLILSILSLHPKLLEHGLGQAACVR